MSISNTTEESAINLQLTPESLGRMYINVSQKDIINFLFMTSFSMAKQITDISGRGVGLDVVKSGIEQLGGAVSVSTELGKGTTFTVRLPLTLAIIQALMVEDVYKRQVENKPLARMLFHNVDLGAEIPPELYRSVAEILAMIYKENN